jgi:hypothetical protein
MSWADICETSDKEDNKFEDKESTKEVSEDATKYDRSKAQEPKAEQKVIKDKNPMKTNQNIRKARPESDASVSVEDTEYSTMRNERNPNFGWIKQVGVQSGCETRKFLL